MDYSFGLREPVHAERMPQPQRVIPESLGSVFSVEAARNAGVARKVLRHPRFDRPFHGIRVVPDPSVPDRAGRARGSDHVLVRARQFRPRLRPAEAFSHETALVLLGCPIRYRGELHTSVPHPHVRNRSRGVIGHNCDLYDAREFVDDLPVVPAHVALLQAARTLPIKELIVALDHLILSRNGEPEALLDLSRLTQWLSARSSRGVRTLRSAAKHARVGAESRMETLTRLTLAVYGLDEYFELQRNVSDARGWIGRFDLVCEAKRVIVEYDGEQHREDRRQYLRDVRRLERVRDAGYRVIRVHREDLFWSPFEVVGRVAMALGLDPRRLELRNPSLRGSGRQ